MPGGLLRAAALSGVVRHRTAWVHILRVVGVCALAPAACALLRRFSGRLRRVGAGWAQLALSVRFGVYAQRGLCVKTLANTTDT